MNVNLQSRQTREGFAEWVSYTCLTAMISSFTDKRDEKEVPRMPDKLETNLAPAYRNGLKQFRDIEKTRSRDAVILEAKKVEEKA